MKQAMYRATVFMIAQAMKNPPIASPMLPEMWYVLSLYLPEDRPTTKPKNPDTRYGGQVKTRVIVRLKPRVPSTVGKKLLKPQAERCMFWMKQSR